MAPLTQMAKVAAGCMRIPRKLTWRVRKALFPGSSFIVPLPECDAKLSLYVGDEVSYQIYLSSFEVNVRRYLCDTLKPGMTFMDVGANLGLHTVLAAKLVGPSGRVFSFEPSRREFERLNENVRLNSMHNVTTHRCAVSDRGGKVLLTVCDDEFGGFNSIGTVSHPAARDHVSHQEEVGSICLDEFVDTNDIGNLDVVKIDVEGAEVLTLKGARKLLSGAASPKVLCELCDLTAAGLGVAACDVRKLLKEYGYSVYSLRDYCKSGLLPAEEKDWVHYEDVVALKR